MEEMIVEGVSVCDDDLIEILSKAFQLFINIILNVMSNSFSRKL